MSSVEVIELWVAGSVLVGLVWIALCELVDLVAGFRRRRRAAAVVSPPPFAEVDDVSWGWPERP